MAKEKSPPIRSIDDISDIVFFLFLDVPHGCVNDIHGWGILGKEMFEWRKKKARD